MKVWALWCKIHKMYINVYPIPSKGMEVPPECTTEWKLADYNDGHYFEYRRKTK